MDSMEDAAQEAYIHYHGQRYEAMNEDRFRFLPRYDPNDGTWVIQNPQISDPTLDATVRHVHVMQKEIDALRAQLGLPPLYEKKPPEFTVIDTAP